MDLDATPTGADESQSVESRIEDIIAPSVETPPENEAQQPQEQETVKVEETQETETQEVTSEQQETQDTESIEYDADDIASLFGIDPEYLSVNEDGTASFKTKVNGEEQSATLQDLIKGHQLEANVNRKSMELSDAQKKFDEERLAQLDTLNSQLKEATQMSQMMENQLLQEYNNIDWNTLRNTDPAEFAALQQEYNQKYQQVQGYKQQVQQQQEQTNEYAKQEQQAWMQKQVAAHQQELLKKLPEWNDREVAAKEATAIERYAIESLGISPDEAAQIYDHRHIIALRKAMLFDQMQTQTKPEAKKVTRKIRVQKPTVEQSKATANKSAQAKRRATLKKTGSIDAAASVLADMI